MLSLEAESPPKQDLDEQILEKIPSLSAGTNPESFPDGGLKAWLVVLGAFCCLFSSFGWINCVGVFQDYYQTHQLKQYSPSTIAWIPSLQVFFMFAGGPVIGKLQDNFGPRWILLFGTFFQVFGVMMTSISKSYYQILLAQAVCAPIGASALFYPALNATSTWFFRRRAFALGIVASGSSLGGVIFPIMTEKLFTEVGFGWTMRISAFLMLGLLTIANLTLKSRLPPHPKRTNIAEFFRPMKERSFALLACSSFLFTFGMFPPLVYIIVQATSPTLPHPMSQNLSNYLLPILNAASIFGRTLPGWVGDRIGRFNVQIFMASLSGILVLALWLPARTNASIIVFAALYGFSSGAFVSMTPALVAEISDVRQIGVRMGSLYFIISIAALVTSPIAGALVTRDSGKFTGLQIFAGVMMVAAASVLVATRISVGGSLLMKKV